jgi:hypothetical protein
METNATSPADILEQLTGPLTGEDAKPATKASDLNLDQPVYSPTIGAGRIVAINGERVTVKVENSNGEITEIVVVAAGLITLPQAQAIFDSWWVRGKKWRMKQGRWLWIVNELCILTGHGAWKAWLDEHDDYPKSTAYDHIREYKNEVAWALQDQQAAQKKSAEGDVETSETRTFDPATIIEDRKTQQRVPHTNADELKEVIG